MSLVSLSAVSSIQTTGKSITIAKSASSDDLDAGAELAAGGGRAAAAVSPAIPASARPAGWM